MRMENMTTAIYVEHDGCYLMLHRIKKNGDINRDKWLGIGGHFESGESPEECALREAREETGLTLTALHYRGIITFVQGDYTEYMHLFTASAFTGTLAECDEGTLEWIPRAQVPALPIWEGDRVFLHLLETPRPFFSLKLTYTGDHLTGVILDGCELPRNEWGI